MGVIVDNVSLSYVNSKGQRDHILKDLSLEIPQGEFVSLVGPSGCGKSSLMGMIAGFVKPDQGEVIVADKKVTRPDISRTLVFQEYALFPWLNVIENVAFGLKYIVKDKQERYFRAARYLKLVGLIEHAHSSVSQLSGGMKQRVALARALCVKPDLLLMDEPFGALDDESRTNLQNQLVNIWKELKPTIIFVTHSIEEALMLSDRVVVMSKVRPGSSEPGGFIDKEIIISKTRPRSLNDEEFKNYRSEIKEAFALNGDTKHVRKAKAA